MIIYDDLFVHIGLAYPNSYYEEKSNNGFIVRGKERVAVGVIAAAVVVAFSAYCSCLSAQVT